LPEPAALFPPLAVFAVAVPAVLLPPLAMSAVPVPPLFGVSTGAAAAVIEACCPAPLLPPVAAVEIAAPFSTPVRSVVVASSEISAPSPASAGAIGTLVELPRS
jgi:hypothetical protein